MASWLVRSTPERAVRVRALAGDIVLCPWARHFTLTVPLSTQVYKWVPANIMLGGNPAMDYHPIQGGVEILLVASCYRNRDKLRPDGPHSSNADFTYLSLLQSHFTAAGLIRYDVVKMLVMFASSHTGYHIYENVFNFPNECS